MRLFRFRIWVQVLSAFGFNSYLPSILRSQKLYVGTLKSVPFPVLNCYASPTAIFSCPVGSLQHFSAIKTIPFYVIGIFITAGSIFGRAFCGWLCPFGLVQDLLNRLYRKRLQLPKFTKYFKYIFLVVLVGLIPFLTSEPWFCKLCPQGTFQAGIPQIILQPHLRELIGGLYYIKIIILFLFLVGFIFIPRLFCRTVCPIGAFLSVFNKVSLIQIKVNRERCNECNLCRRVCPVDIEIYKDPSSPECVRCFACTICDAVRVEAFTHRELPRVQHR